MNSCVCSVGIDQESQRTGRVFFIYVPQMFWNACCEGIAMCGFIHFANHKVGGDIWERHGGGKCKADEDVRMDVQL